MTCHVGHFDQSDVFAYTKMNELLSLGEDEQMSYHWRLNLCKVLAKVLDNDVVQASSELDRFLPDQFEALIECCLNFACSSLKISVVRSLPCLRLLSKTTNSSFGSRT